MTRLWGIEQTDVLEHFVGEDGEERVGVDEEEIAVLVWESVFLLIRRHMYQTHYFRSLAQGLLPGTDLLEHSFLIVAKFFRIHAIFIIVSQQPRDLLAPARREWMGEEFHTLLTGE
jgi:hypothetical protein